MVFPIMVIVWVSPIWEVMYTLMIVTKVTLWLMPFVQEFLNTRIFIVGQQPVWVIPFFMLVQVQVEMDWAEPVLHPVN